MTQQPATPRSLAPCPNRPNCVSSRAEDIAHRIDPLALRVPVEIAWPQLRDAVAALDVARDAGASPLALVLGPGEAR